MGKQPFARCIAAAALAAVGFAATAPASAQDYPTKPVRMIVGYPPGGVVDILGRVVAERLSERLGQTVIVENHPGASGIVGNRVAAQAEGDGYTLLMGYFSTLAVHPSLYKDLPYDPVKDYAPIGRIATTPLILVVSPKVQANNLRELIDLAKSRPGRLNYGATGNGSGAHLAAELLKQLAGIQMTQIPYKGSAPALTDLQGDHIQVLFDALPSALPLVNGGKLRAFAVTGATRSALVPDVPTVAESGFPNYQFAPWLGLLAPQGTPPAIVERLNTELNAVLAMPEVAKKLTPLGYQLKGSSPQEFAAFIKSERARWAKFIADAGIKANE